MADNETGFGTSGDGTFILLTGPGGRMSQILDEAAQRAKEKFATAVRPIVGARRGGRHDPVGTCVLIDLDGIPYLFTATHVLKHNADSSLYVGTADGNWQQLEAEFSVVREKDDADPEDRMDISAARLPAEIADALGRKDFIPRSEISRYCGSAKQRCYTFIGYPISQNKGYDPITSTVKSKLRDYTSTGIDDAATYLRAGIHPEQHLAVSYGKFSKVGGLKQFSIDMHGFSGGAVVDVGELGNFEVAGGLSVPDPKLVAIIIEKDSDQDIIFGTRVLDLLDGIIQSTDGTDQTVSSSCS